jgi:putative transposase
VPRRKTERSAGVIFHVMNRAVQDVTLFTSPADYDCFLRVLSAAGQRFGVDLFAFCAMPNHWHLVVRPRESLELQAYMRWLTQTHAQRWRKILGTTGRGAVYQGRYRWVPVQEDRHFLHVCRYVERNPLRAQLVDRAEHWPWSSARFSVCGIRSGAPVAEWPIPRPSQWARLLNEGQPASVVTEIRRCVGRSLPYGDDEWSRAMRTDIDAAERLRGRPPGALSGDGIRFSRW